MLTVKSQEITLRDTFLSVSPFIPPPLIFFLLRVITFLIIVLFLLSLEFRIYNSSLSTLYFNRICVLGVLLFNDIFAIMYYLTSYFSIKNVNFIDIWEIATSCLFVFPLPSYLWLF